MRLLQEVSLKVLIFKISWGFVDKIPCIIY